MIARTPVWYRRRGYAHFDQPLSLTKAEALVASPQAVTQHGFYPIIVFPKRVYRRKTQPDGSRPWSRKIRPLAYVAHSDAHIHAKYASDLSALMEDRYARGPGRDSVIAYRRIDGKCNIDFAHDCFKHIENRGECDVVAIDVRGFFDNLDASYLKQQWSHLLGRSLPDDHYSVFKSVTKDRAIALPTLRDQFRGRVPRRLGRTMQRVCEPYEFRQIVVPHLEPRHTIVSRMKGDPDVPKGIPQGTPISAVLANLYMYNVDVQIENDIRQIDGYYRRYSDDILVIVKPGCGAAAEEIVRNHVAAAMLEVHNDKRTATCFDSMGVILIARERPKPGSQRVNPR